jgi:ornithine lipid ester-linked acyl 2-hydroxylase
MKINLNVFFTNILAQRLLPWMEQMIEAFSPSRDQAFFDVEEFPWIAELEANWMIVRQELDEVLREKTRIPKAQSLNDIEYLISQQNCHSSRKVYAFYFYGHQNSEYCQTCPETTKLLQKIPDMKTAAFSILTPNHHLATHRGEYKGVLRYHLGLRIPSPRFDCGIQVKDEIAHWEEGKSLVFDDTHPHSAWNHTNQDRVVLLIDIIRPLPFPLSLLNRGFHTLMEITDVVKQPIQKQKLWNRNLYNTPKEGLNINSFWQSEWINDLPDTIMQGQKLAAFLQPSQPRLKIWLRVLNEIHQRSQLPEVIGIMCQDDHQDDVHRNNEIADAFKVNFPLIFAPSTQISSLVNHFPTIAVLDDGLIHEVWIDKMPWPFVSLLKTL